jgi:putative membrane protein
VRTLPIHPNILIGILLLFYAVGSVGLVLPGYRTIFLGLSSYNLLLTFVIAALSFDRWNGTKILFLVLCYLIGMLAEWIGTSTGYLFGSYYYGKNLGIDFAGVPLVIGINWWILIVSSASLARAILTSTMAKALLGATFMTLLDVLMEPVAIKSDFWHWHAETIPIYNYVCWFFLSFLLHLLYQKLTLAESNKVLNVLFFVLVVFFGIQLIF